MSAELQFKVASIGESDDGAHRFVFGWVEGIDGLSDREIEERAVSLMLACQRGGGVAIAGLGTVAETCVFTAEKQASIGVALGGTRWWMGIEVPDKKLWKSLRSNQLFDLQGVCELTTAAKRAAEQEIHQMNLRAPEVDCGGVIAKCMNAVRKNDVAGITTADCDDAIQQLGEQLAAKRDIAVEKGVGLALETAEGKAIYELREAARIAKMAAGLPG